MNLLSFLALSLTIYVILTPFILYFLFRRGTKNLKRDQQLDQDNYERLYESITYYIYDWPLEYKSLSSVLDDLLTQLESMPYKNPEKTEVLRNKYLKRVKEVNVILN